MERYRQPRYLRSGLGSAIRCAGCHDRKGDARKLVGDGDRDQLERLGLHQLLRPAAERVGRSCQSNRNLSPIDASWAKTLIVSLRATATRPGRPSGGFGTSDDQRDGAPS